MFMLCNDKLHLPIYLHETLLAQMFVFCSCDGRARAPLIYKIWTGPNFAARFARPPLLEILNPPLESNNYCEDIYNI